MDFTLNNGLSMVGGDDFTNIYQQIDTLNQTVVFKAGTQTITGDKTITGDLVVDNLNTDIDSDSILLSSGGALNVKYNQSSAATVINNSSISLQLGGSGVFSAISTPSNDTTITGDDNVFINSGGITKVDITPTQSLIENDILYISNTAGSVGFQILPTDLLIQAPVGGAITADIGANNTITINSTDTTLTNGDIFLTTTTGIIEATAADGVILNGVSSGVGLEVAGTTKLQCATTTTTLTNDTTNIVSGVANKAAITSSTTTLNNTTTNIQSGGTNKITTTATTTTLNNTGENRIQISGTDKISVLSASTTLNNTATSIQSGGQFKYSQNATDTQIRNTLVQLQAGVLDVKYNQTATQTDIENDTINITSTGGIAGQITVQAAVISMNDASGNTLFDQDKDLTIIDNAEIRLRTSGTTRYYQEFGNTTLTNTSINAVGNLYTSAYLLGTSGGSNIRLASIQLPLGTVAIPTGSSSPATITGNWSYTGTSTQMRTPSWGYFYPLYALIGFDNGTITGGGTMTISIRLREETNNYDYSTDAFTLTSGTNNAPTGAASNFTTFTAGSNDRISGGVLIRAQIVLTRTANITASTKSCYFTAYGYQLT